MTDEMRPAPSLAIEIIETVPGKITVSLTGDSPETQRVAYELATRGSSQTIHKGETTLVAHTPAVLSTVSFSRSDCWSVTLNVTEEVAGKYSITRGTDCD